MDRITKSFFPEEKALPFAHNLAGIWPKGIAINWFWLAFQALEKAGLTYFETDDEEMQVRERLTLLAVFYYEFCHISAFHESENFTYWDEDTINRFKKDFSVEVDDNLFEVRNALIKYFGSEENVIAELWVNCLEGSSNSFIKLKEKAKLYNELLNSSEQEIKYAEVRDWFVGWGIGIEDFESIAY